jgi:hypothetical protein
MFIVSLITATGVLAQPTLPDTLWTRTYGTGSARSVAVTGDGGLFILAESSVNRTNAAGDSLWKRRYEVSNAWTFLATEDGGFIIVGSLSNEALLLQADTDGDTLRTGIIHLDSLISISDAARCSDGGIVFAATVRGSDAYHNRTLLAKIDADWNLEWSRVFNAGYQWGSNGRSVVQTSDGGFLLTGSTNELHVSQAFVRKTNGSGNEQWQYTVGQYNYSPAVAYDAIQTADGGYAFTYVGGSSYFNIRLARFDSTGTQQWVRNYNSPRGSTANAVAELSNGGFALAGYAQTAADKRLNVIGTDSVGNAIWNFVLQDSSYDEATAMAMMPDGGLAVVGYLNGNSIFAMRLAGDPEGISGRPRLIPEQLNLSVFPNPFNATASLSYLLGNTSEVRLCIYDLMGREVTTLAQAIEPAGKHRVVWNAENTASGVYFARLQAGEFSRTMRVVLMK